MTNYKYDLNNCTLSIQYNCCAEVGKQACLVLLRWRRCLQVAQDLQG